MELAIDRLQLEMLAALARNRKKVLVAVSCVSL